MLLRCGRRLGRTAKIQIKREIQIKYKEKMLLHIVYTAGSGRQWPIGGSGGTGAPSSIIESCWIFRFSISGKHFKMIFPVSWALVIVEMKTVSMGILRSFKRSPVSLAWWRPVSVKNQRLYNFTNYIKFLYTPVNILSLSLVPLVLYWPCLTKIKWRTEVGLCFSNLEL